MLLRPMIHAKLSAAKSIRFHMHRARGFVRGNVLAWAAACSLGAGVTAASAATVAGQQFDERIRLADADLVLNGVGVRSVAVFKAYAAALYLPQKSKTPAQVLAHGGPRRLQLVMLTKAPSNEFSKAVRGGVQKNSTAAELSLLQPSVEAFCQQVDALGQLKSGDVILVDFSPQGGISLSLNGKTQSVGLAEPAALFRGILRIFVGDKPVDERLKAGILGQ
jgi:hypothetical protein